MAERVYVEVVSTATLFAGGHLKDVDGEVCLDQAARYAQFRVVDELKVVVDSDREDPTAPSWWWGWKRGAA